MNSRVTLDNKEAVVLHRYDYRNSSLIVHFFISDYGKISAVARGVRGKKKSKYNHQALLQPYKKVLISLTGKQELMNLTSIESTTVDWNLPGKSLYCAYYINELLLRLLPTHCDCQPIFQLYKQVLSLLSECSTQETQQPMQQSIYYEAPLRLFELNLLEFLGYGLNLRDEIQSGCPVEADELYYYDIESGPSKVKLSNIRTIPIHGGTLINLFNKQMCDHKTLQESKPLLKWALAVHLGNKPLKSRQLFKQLYC